MKKFLSKMLRQLADRIESGECEMTNDEMISMMRLTMHEKWYLPRLEHEFNTTQRTIERWCKDGTLPPLHKDDTGHKYLWHDEVEAWRMRRHAGH